MSRGPYACGCLGYFFYLVPDCPAAQNKEKWYPSSWKSRQRWPQHKQNCLRLLWKIQPSKAVCSHSASPFFDESYTYSTRPFSFRAKLPIWAFSTWIFCFLLAYRISDHLGLCKIDQYRFTIKLKVWTMPRRNWSPAWAPTFPMQVNFYSKS